MPWHTSSPRGAAFDMFASLFFGKNPRTCQGSEKADPRGLLVCQGMEDASKVVMDMMRNPKDPIMNALGLESANFKKFARGFDIAFKGGEEIVQDFVERRDLGQLTEAEQKSYLSGLLKREEDSEAVSQKEAVQIASFLISVAVDTTSSLINWALLHIAMNSDVQEKLRAELQETLKGGDLTEEVVSSGKGWLPYMHAIMRESHRMTPALFSSIMKTINKDMTICGYDFPEGTAFMLEGHAAQNDPALMPDHKEFKPERWLPEAVEERAGTEAAVLDHPLWRAPFSAGARMCPGSRVASLEIFALVCRVVQDYDISVDGVSSYDDIGRFTGATCMPSPMPKFNFVPRSQE